VSLSSLRTDYASLFAELFCCNLAILHTPEFRAAKRTTARKKSDCDFGEADLQRLIADRERRMLPNGCPGLYVDKEHKGRIDYKFFGARDEILATCQLKGPLRAQAEKELDNGFGPILEDIAKQRREAENLKYIKHYVGILFCLDKARAEQSVANVWLPALRAETTALLSQAAMRDTPLVNGYTATACILDVKLRTHYDVKLRTHYPCGCPIREQI
jgi:hypothetical protein